jgi:FKBP-type peptidyl-prolyl cis-trans isomerase SlpA
MASGADKASRVALRDLDREREVTLPAFAEGAVAPGKKVTLNFALKLGDNEVVDSNFDKEPVSFVVGDGNMLPGFEQALLGLEEGQCVDAIIPAAQAFGAVNPDNQQRFPRFHFPPDMALSENLMIEFTDASGFKQAGRVLSIGARYVEIDFNHPLAGRDILFSARVHKVEDSVEPMADARSN